MKKSILVLSIVTILSLNTFAGNVPGDRLDYYNPERSTIQSKVEVIDLTGKGPEAVAAYLATLERATPDSEVLQLAKNAIENNKTIAPAYAKMMEAQAKMRDVGVHELYAAVSQMDWSVNKSIIKSTTPEELSKAATKMRGCTTLAFSDTGIVAQTNDLSLDYLLTKSPTRIIKTDDTIFLPTDGGQFQGMGRSVSVVLNIMGDPSGTTATLDTPNIVTNDAVFAAITSSDSVEDAYNKIKNYTTPVAMNFTVADKYGDHGAFEISVDGVKWVKGQGGTGHANHTAEMKARMLEKMTMPEANEAFVDSFARQQAAQNFVDYTREKTVDGMKYILNQRPINLAFYDKNFVTVEAIIFDTKAGVAYVTGDNPLFTEYTKVSFD